MYSAADRASLPKPASGPSRDFTDAQGSTPWWNCRLTEVEGGSLVNAATNQPFSMSDSCVRQLPTRRTRTYDEDDLREFVRAHWTFFRSSSGRHDMFVEILWPKIDQYRRIWKQRREGDYWAAGKAMAADLAAANISAPEWPPSNQEEPDASVYDWDNPPL